MGTKVQKDTEKNKFFDIKKRMVRKKFFSYNLAKKLFEEFPNSDMSKHYKDSMFCKGVLSLEVISPEEALTHSSYCKHRNCPECNRIRTAILYKSYKPELSKFKEPCFVTLTAPNVTAENLKNEVDLYFSNFRKILKANTQRKNKFIGIRKFECTTNEEENTYHPHFHVIIDTYKNAKILQDDWLKLMPNAKLEAQDIQKIKVAEFEDSLLEMFKYFTKLFNKKYKKDKKGHYIRDKKGHRVPILDEDGKAQIYLPNLAMLDFMFCTIKGKRIFQPFGGIKKVSEELTDEDIKSRIIPITEEQYNSPYPLDYKFNLKSDYENMYNAKDLFSGYEPSDKDKKIFNITD